MYGVNLGGWLVVEKWMTPSLFQGLAARNEYELSQTATGWRRLRQHHRQFITEADFVWLHKHEVRAVRLPVGHWVFGDAPPYVGALPRLDWAFAMAEKYGLQVLLDLHAAPGAQNTADHSGSGQPGQPSWLDSAQKREATIEVLERLVQRYNPSPAFWGIELVNEPLARGTGLKLVRFYRQAYARVRAVARPGLYTVFSDGYHPLLLAGALRSTKRHPVAMDCHFYQCFGAGDTKRRFGGHLAKARRRRLLIWWLQRFHPVVVGEWSATLPLTLSSKQQREYIRAQQIAHQGALTEYYWAYKLEATGTWHYRWLVESGKMKSV